MELIKKDMLDISSLSPLINSKNLELINGREIDIYSIGQKYRHHLGETNFSAPSIHIFNIDGKLSIQYIF